jgi:hypothetical protein
VFGSIHYGKEDAVRKNNQGVSCTNAGMLLAVIAVRFHVFTLSSLGRDFTLSLICLELSIGDLQEHVASEVRNLL